ncbi:MAG: response regulator [Desulfitobacteriaceae bacterium]
MINDDYILIVDDNKGIRTLLEEFLKSENYKVKTASNGIEALHLIRQTLPSVVLLDFKMPVMSGLEVLKVIDTVWTTLPVIIISAYTKNGKLFQDGLVRYFLTKPFDLKSLGEMLRTIIENINNTDKTGPLSG